MANPIYQSHTNIELISDKNNIQPGSDFLVGLKFDMDEDWHVYWINPGDSGLAPSVAWGLPQGLSASEILWPYPHRIDVEHLTSYGYKDVCLLSKFSFDTSGSSIQNLAITANVKWLACKIECIPGEAQLVLNLPVTAQATAESIDEHNSKILSGWMSQVPQKGFQGDVSLVDDKDKFVLTIQSLLEIKSAQFFSRNNTLIQHSSGQEFYKENNQYHLSLTKSALFDSSKIKDAPGVLVAQIDQDGKTMTQSLEISPSITQGQTLPRQDRSAGGLNFLTAILFAFIGGLILNLMPCVLPVLSIKILGLVAQAENDKKEIMRHGLLYSLGILASFLFLAGFIIILKHSGEQVGWGVQFQSPIFLIFMSVLFFWLGLNLLGVFEVATSISKIDQAFGHPLMLRNPFFNGVLATIVATPCTAPFMGSALGFALSQTWFVSLGIFTALGIGMAFPYLVLSMNTKLLKYVPNPGEWMLQLKKFFGFLFLATVVWLSSILAKQKGADAVVFLYFGLLLISVAAWIIGEWAAPLKSNKVRWMARITAIIIFLIGFKVILNGALMNSTADRKVFDFKSGRQIPWLDFNQEQVDERRRQGERVFIDFTAEWCLTCKVNEALAFENKDVIELFKQKNIRAFKADWTNYNPQVTKALERLGKSSIPVYVFYPNDKNAETVFLPELITPAIVIKTIRENLID